MEEEYVDLDWNEEEEDMTSKASTATTPPPPALEASKAEALKSPPPKNSMKRIFDENHLEGSGADQDLGDDEDLLLEGSATTERYSDDSSVDIVDLGNIFGGI